MVTTATPVGKWPAKDAKVGRGVTAGPQWRAFSCAAETRVRRGGLGGGRERGLQPEALPRCINGRTRSPKNFRSGMKS